MEIERKQIKQIEMQWKHIKDKKVINRIIRMAAMITAGWSATIIKEITYQNSWIRFLQTFFNPMSDGYKYNNCGWDTQLCSYLLLFFLYRMQILV